MYLEPIYCKLKNGLTVSIRSARPEDADRLVALKLSYIEKSQFIPMRLAEYPNTADQEKEYINGFLKSDNSLLLVAEGDGQLLGNIDLTGSKRSIMKHTAC